MRLSGIKNLYVDMKRKKINRYKFEFIYAKVEFDVIFFIDEEPFILMFGVKKNNFYFEVEVRGGFSIIPIFEQRVYKKIVELFDFIKLLTY